MSAARAAALLPPRKEPPPPPTTHEMMLASAIGAAVRIVEKGHREALVAAAASAGPVAARDAAVAKADATFSMRWQTVQEELAKCGFESRALRSRALADASSGKNSPLMQIGPMDCRSVRLRYQAAHPAWKSDAVAAKNLRPAAPPAANAWTTRPPGAAANAAGLKPTPKLAKRPSPPPSPALRSEHDTPPAAAVLVEPAMPPPPPPPPSTTTHAAAESERRPQLLLPQPQQRPQPQPQPQPQPLPQPQRRPTAPVPSACDGPSGTAPTVATTVLFASGWGGLDPSVLASLSAEAESDALAFRVRSCGRDAVVAGPDGRALPPISDDAAFTAPWPAAVDDGAPDQPCMHSVHSEPCERTASGGSTASTPSPPSAPAPISLPTGVPLRISDVLAAAAANYTGAKFDSDSPLLEPDDSIWDTRPSPVPSPPRAAPCAPASSGCRSRR